MVGHDDRSLGAETEKRDEPEKSEKRISETPDLDKILEVGEGKKPKTDKPGAE